MVVSSTVSSQKKQNSIKKVIFAKRKRPQTSVQKGKKLERRVIEIVRKEGYANVQTGIFLKDQYGNRSEIDVVYGRFFKTYIECKNYSSKPVPLHDVAKFKEVLQLNNIPVSRGIFVTTSYYTPRATTIGIRTIDGEQLRQWEKRASTAARRRTFRYIGLFGMTGCALGLYQAPYLLTLANLRETNVASSILKVRHTIADWLQRTVARIS